jgi:glutathione S-transferase
MELYFEPMACSLGTRISLYEAGAEAEFHCVDVVTKRVQDGSDFYAVNGMGQVPVLRTDAGELITENLAILHYVADSFPHADLAPKAGIERYKLHQWLSFTATELHKVVFAPIVDPTRHAGAIEYALKKAERRFAYLDEQLAGRETLLERFSIADAYLVTILSWSRHVEIDLGRWTNVKSYASRLRKRASVSRAFTEELALFKLQQARRNAVPVA